MFNLRFFLLQICSLHEELGGEKTTFSLFCDAWQDKEHPEVDPEDQEDLEDDLSHDRLSEVEGPVHYHGAELNQDHDQEGSRHLILRER